MKKVLLATFLSFFCFSIAKAQNPTYADIPDSSHVLVVYNSLSDTSKFVKNYYVNARGIPESNIVGLDGLYDDWITDPATGVPHYIKLEQGEDGEKEKIVDQQRAYCPMYRHAWLYFNERIAIPISNKLKTTNENGDTLKNIIRFIVLCKGVPFRIVTGTEYSESCNQNVPVDALLCFLGETIDNPDALLNYFNDECTAPDPLPPCVGSYGIENPYYNVDPNFSMDHHFIPNHYSKYNSHFGRDIALSYLITHLDATSLDIVENMIDSSIVAINSTNYDWFIDSDPSPCKGTSFILHPSDTEDAFEDLEITNYFIEYSDDVYTNHNKPIMSYSSNGIHTSENPNDKCDLYFPENYIQTQLDFTYIAGSVFNTAESFNANTLGTFPIIRGANHGQLPEFFLKGGTVGVGQVKHGTNGGIIISNKIMMPSYALGYSFIEAAYLGMKNLTDNRIIVGDPLTRIYDCPEQILTGTLNSGTYSCRIIVPEGGTLTIPSGAIVNFERNGSFRILGTLIINENAVLNFYNKSTWKCFENGKIIIDPGVTVNLNDKSLFSCYGSFISNGTASNFAKFNIRNFDKKMSFNNSDTINVSFTTIKKGKFDISKDLSSQIFTDILFQDCVFDSCITPIDILDPQKLSQFKIINNQLTNTEGFGIRIDGSQLGDISNVNIGSIDFSLSRSGIDINEVDSLDVYNAIINEFNDGILIDNSSSITIKSSTVNDCNNGIVINNISSVSSGLKGNTITNSTNQGITVTNVVEFTVQNNTLTDSRLGVYLANVTNAHIIDNTITSGLNTMPGIFLESTDGDVRGNTISGHTNGIQLGNSSPDIGDNTITDNLYHGIYIGSGSLPNMVGTLAGSPPLQYPTAGYNDIFENGDWDDPNSPPDNDGSEIFISFANALMERGCNSIMDDRVPGGNLINTLYLMSGENFGMPIQVNAEYNYWSFNPLYPLLQDRFINLIVYYSPFDSIPCTLPQGASGGGSELFVTASNGAIIDTLYSIDTEIGNLSTIELLYAVAEEKFLTADYENAEGVYNQIINSNDSLTAKLKAYQRLYNLGRLTNKNPDYFSDLKTVYSSLSQSATDSLLGKIFSQLASLSLIGQTEYVNVIEEFDAVVQQNQGSEEAMYAEIDALTTALLLAPDSSLGKGSFSKYAVTDISDYTNRVSSLLKQRSESSIYNKEPIPTEYALYQNYPNPFNPSTTIKYSIIKTGKVKLAVYDILGREVMVLANEVMEPGFYEVNFDASYLSSGVYFYRIVAEDFVNTKKMLMIK